MCTATDPGGLDQDSLRIFSLCCGVPWCKPRIIILKPWIFLISLFLSEDFYAWGTYIPNDVLAGTASLLIQNETHERTTVSIQGMYV